jgi:hypothetical protein
METAHADACAMTARLLSLGLLLLSAPSAAYSYSVLTHEAIIDSTWDAGIRPLLLKRFPGALEEDLVKAHAFAYGGSIIQDLGYYPFGSKFYSDLTHYVRSGDYILALIQESQDLNEYAFALGALAHYAGDKSGHSIAVNVTVPLLFPELRKKFGRIVTYADSPPAHAKTEFGFDVFQASRGRYASSAYKDFIGFEVSKPVMERAFEKTYGMELGDVFLNVDLAIGSYRRAIGTVLPALTRVAWQLHKEQLRKEIPGVTRKKFLYNLSRASYTKTWGSNYQRPGIGSRILAFFIRILPKVGPLSPFKFKKMTPEAENLYMASVNATIDRYRLFLADLGSKRLKLPNENIDTGDPTIAGKYSLTDAAYAKLLHKLADRKPEAPIELRKDILAFYHDLSLPIATKRDPEEWSKVLSELNQWKALELSAETVSAATIPKQEE